METTTRFKMISEVYERYNQISRALEAEKPWILFLTLMFGFSEILVFSARYLVSITFMKIPGSTENDILLIDNCIDTYTLNKKGNDELKITKCKKVSEESKNILQRQLMRISFAAKERPEELILDLIKNDTCPVCLLEYGKLLNKNDVLLIN